MSPAVLRRGPRVGLRLLFGMRHGSTAAWNTHLAARNMQISELTQIPRSNWTTLVYTDAYQPDKAKLVVATITGSQANEVCRLGAAPPHICFRT